MFLDDLFSITKIKKLKIVNRITFDILELTIRDLTPLTILDLNHQNY